MILLRNSSSVLNNLKQFNLFSNLNKHMFDTDVENNHILKLIKLISSNCSKIRIHHFVNLETKSSHGINIRQKLTKIILFKHQ